MIACVARAVGMKMVADLRQFSGVNENIIKEQLYIRKTLIENSLQNTNYTQHCETKKVTDCALSVIVPFRI